MTVQIFQIWKRKNNNSNRVLCIDAKYKIKKFVKSKYYIPEGGLVWAKTSYNP